MSERSSRHIERCRICHARIPLMSELCNGCETEKGPFKAESCKRCKFNTTQLFLETKTVRKFCLNCRDFTENSDSLIQTEIFFCIDCHVLMEISSDGANFICPRCSWVKKKNLFVLKRLQKSKIIIFRKYATN